MYTYRYIDIYRAAMCVCVCIHTCMHTYIHAYMHTDSMYGGVCGGAAQWGRGWQGNCAGGHIANTRGDLLPDCDQYFGLRRRVHGKDAQEQRDDWHGGVCVCLSAYVDRQIDR